MATCQLRNLEEVTLFSSLVCEDDTRICVHVLHSMPDPWEALAAVSYPRVNHHAHFTVHSAPVQASFSQEKNDDAAAADQYSLPQEQHGGPGREKGPITPSPRWRARCGSVQPPRLPLPACEARDVTGAQATCTRRIVYYWSLAREQADRQSKKIR